MIDLAAFGLPPGLQAVDPDNLTGGEKPSTWENLKALYAPAETDEQRDRSESLLAFGAGLLQAPGAAGLGKGFNNFLQTRQYNEQRNFERIMRDELLKVSQLNADTGAFNAETSRHNALNDRVSSDEIIAARAGEDLVAARKAELEGNAVEAARLRKQADQRLERNMTDKAGEQGRVRDDKIADYRRLYPDLTEAEVVALADDKASIEVSPQTGMATYKNELSGEVREIKVQGQPRPPATDAPSPSVWSVLQKGTGVQSAISAGAAVAGALAGWEGDAETITARDTMRLAMDRFAQTMANTRSYEQVKQYREQLASPNFWRSPSIAAAQVEAMDAQVRQIVAQEERNAIDNRLSATDRAASAARAASGRDTIESLWGEPNVAAYESIRAKPAWNQYPPERQTLLRLWILKNGLPPE